MIFFLLKFIWWFHLFDIPLRYKIATKERVNVVNCFILNALLTGVRAPGGAQRRK